MHVNLPLIPLIKNKNFNKSEEYFVKIKVRTKPKSKRLDLLEYKMSFFHNSKPYELLVFISNFNMTLEVSEPLKYNANIK